MTEVINELQAYQNDAINHGMSFTLDIINQPDEIKALVTIRSTISDGLADEQRYTKVTISSDEETEFVQTKLTYIGNFIYQVTESEKFHKE